MDLNTLEGELDTLLARVDETEARHADAYDAVTEGMRASARNLIHYVASRQVDLRPLQHALRNLGLSSLGRMEPCVAKTLHTVRNAVHQLAGKPTPETAPLVGDTPGFDDGAMLLLGRAERLFGPGQDGRDARVMVTMPTEAAHEPELVHNLVEAGMDVMRINCAHDDVDAWRAMIANLRAAEAATGRTVRISADLAGPKLRTGAPAQTIQVMRLRPRRSARGKVLAPATVTLEGEDAFPLPATVAAAAAAGDQLDVRDARDRWRRGTVVRCNGGLTAEFTRTLYAEPGARVRLRRDGKRIAQGHLGALPDVEVPLTLSRGECVRLLRQPHADPASPRSLGCSLPAALTHVKPGHAVWFDDGRIGGKVVNVDQEGLDIEIRYLPGASARLRAEKGINLPDTPIDLPALGADDIAALEALAGEIDLVGMSFVRTPADVLALHRELDRIGAAEVAVELKIENRQAFEHLPQIMLAAMQRGPFAVMVARGDLAVEVGFERLAEVQEEILWLCEAAHTPVIWATQVLEELAKRGSPSRAEVTDAAMAERAECVMLNKGPYVCEAVEFLDGVLRRMQEHQYKKRAKLRPLGVSTLA